MNVLTKLLYIGLNTFIQVSVRNLIGMLQILQSEIVDKPFNILLYAILPQIIISLVHIFFCSLDSIAFYSRETPFTVS